MNSKTFAPGKIAQYYALLAWNGMNAEEALKTITEQSYDKLNETTYAGDSVTAAKKGIEKYLLKGKSEIDNDQITGIKKMDYYGFIKESNILFNNFNTEEEICDAVIKILVEIHDKWVTDNAKKYDRDKDKNDKRLFQHLPTALIGVDEVAKDLMFLAPIMDRLGYSVGKMTHSEWGAFIPTQKVCDAYNRYVDNYKEANGIKTEEDLINHISHVTETYDALKVENAPSGKEDFFEKRVSYMADKARVDLLTSQVEAKNKECFTLESENGANLD